MSTLRITNGRVIDPSQAIDQVTDLWVRGEHVRSSADRVLLCDTLALQIKDSKCRVVLTADEGGLLL